MTLRLRSGAELRHRLDSDPEGAPTAEVQAP